ncbi:unnamed protein product [Gongylonema pulchrum]|uniref:Uncharacterized protein n=1 Tax=Gongylonema pulchrum TaxID=637853 RepID=A0A183E007_9BILA|nr:unnamed protein product [Gongylonema pulchrum]
MYLTDIASLDCDHPLRCRMVPSPPIPKQSPSPLLALQVRFLDSTPTSTEQTIARGVGCSKQALGTSDGVLPNGTATGIPQRDASVSSDSTPTSTEQTIGRGVGCSKQALGTSDGVLPNGTATGIPQRDASVSSGLADSESSPLSPSAPKPSVPLRRSISDRKPEMNKNRSRVAPIEINTYDLDDGGGGGGKVRSPPPPSPRSSTEKRRSSVLLATDLFAFSAGRVPERAESCEELDAGDDELYSQKKQKAGEYINFFLNFLSTV